jgi:hypothetical protein
VGSGAIGLSLNPNKMIANELKTFDDKSDLDIALISDPQFDMAWRDLRELAHPALNELEAGFQKSIEWQKKRFFDGAILTNKLLPYLKFGPEWMGASARLSELVSREFSREIDINFWIYRDYWSLRSYVANSILKCKECAE